MAAAGGGRAVSMTPEEYAEDEARAWWAAEIAGMRDNASTCRTALNFPDVTRENGRRLNLEPERAAFVAGHVETLLEGAEYVLANPEAYWPDTWGRDDLDLIPFAPSMALEVADRVIACAWRLLMAAARSTRNLRALMGIGRLMVRVAALRLRLTNRPAQTVEDRDTRAHRERRERLISLTQAAHAPPRGALALSPAITGGGPL